jgi:predicted NAD/FAD-dependent oxidoreductase
MPDFDIAIIGAGMTGLTAAQILQQAGYQVVLLEKSRGVGGRLATRRLANGRADHGTCYVSPKGDVFEQFIQTLCDRGVVQVWTDAVYELSPDGQLHPPTEQSPRYVAPDGMSAIAKWLTPNLDIRFSQRVVKLANGEEQWHLTLATTLPDGVTSQHTEVTAKAVIVTTPAPQAAELLATLPESVLPAEFRATVQSVDFAPCISVMAGYPSDCLQDWQQRYGDVKAIAAQESDLGWIGLDSSKRKAPAQPVFVLQSGADFATQHLETADLTPVGRSLLDTTAHLLAPWFSQPEWMQVHRWRYAFAQQPLPDPYLRAPAIAPLFCAGDWCGGMRVESAVLSGMAVAHATNQELGQQVISAQRFWPQNKTP